MSGTILLIELQARNSPRKIRLHSIVFIFYNGPLYKSRNSEALAQHGDRLDCW